MAYVRELPTNAKRQYVRGERPTWEWDGLKFKASDVWLVPTADLATFQRVVCGTIEDIGGLIDRIVPLRFKEYEFATAVRMMCLTPEGAPDGNEYWPYERIRVEYESPDYGEDYLSVSFSPFKRTDLKPTTTYFGLADDSIDGMTYNVTYHRLASVPLDTWADAAGKINNATWKGFPAYCVKFGGPNGQQRQQFNGVTFYSPTLRFDVSRQRWDQTYDATGALISKGVPAAIDFTALFG